MKKISIKKMLAGVLFGLISLQQAAAQFATPTIDANITSGTEYGTHTDGQNQETTANGGGTTTWYCTWDNTYIYFAVMNANETEYANVYIDVNPTQPGNAGIDANGSKVQTWDSRNHDLSFRAEFNAHVKNTDRQIFKSDGAGGWTAIRTGPHALSGTDDYTSSFYSSHANGNGAGADDRREFRIAWNDVTNGAGRPASFRWLGFISYNGGTYAKVPDMNPSGTSTGRASGEDNYFCYEVLNTADGASTKPFNKFSFTCYDHNINAGTADGYIYGGVLPASLHNFVVHDYSADNSDNDPTKFRNHANISNRVYIDKDITIENDLYVGMGSSFIPNTAKRPTITLSALDGAGSIWDTGRISSCPEDNAYNDVYGASGTRMSWLITGNVYIENTYGLNKDKFRISNLTINSGASLNSSATAGVNTYFEFEFGTFTNNGTLDLWVDNSNHVNCFIRGDWTNFSNEFTFEGTGTFDFHHLGIGRRPNAENTRSEFPNVLRPNTTQALTLNIKGDFQNYSEFVGKNSSGELNIVFNGTKPQYIKGNFEETRRVNHSTQTPVVGTYFVQSLAASSAFTTNVSPRTIFHKLTVDNAGNDVFFETYTCYGCGTISANVATNIQYYITSELNLTSGDLVTRNRTSSCGAGVDYHIVTVMNNATINYSGLVGTNTGSYFVDGPIRWEMLTGASTKVFPIGKEIGTFGGYRAASLTADNSTKCVYQGELIECDAYGSGGAHGIDPNSWGAYATTEQIGYMPQPRYWRISLNPDGVGGVQSAATSAAVNFNYGADDYALVSAANKLRVVKAATSGGTWTNISGSANFGSGDGSGSGSNINSDNFTTFSDFSLGSTDPFPVELLFFTAAKKEKQVELNWATASEENSDYFEVEHSADAVYFKAIGSKIEAAGNSSARNDYAAIDSNPFDGVNYYRLKQVDTDGSVHYSKTATVFMNTVSANLDNLHVSDETLHITTVFAKNTNVKIAILDALGRSINQYSLEIQEGRNQYKLDINHLSKGVYILSITDNNGIQLNRKFIK